MITAENLALQMQDTLGYDDLIDPVKFASLVATEFAKIHVQEALKEASKKVKSYVDTNGEWTSSHVSASIDKSSILNAYPLTNIK